MADYRLFRIVAYKSLAPPHKNYKYRHIPDNRITQFPVRDYKPKHSMLLIKIVQP